MDNSQSQERSYRISSRASTFRFESFFVDALRSNSTNERAAKCSLLVHARERLYLEFESLRVLPLDLHFRLQFLDKKIEASDFRTQFLYVCRSGSGTGGRSARLL